MRLIVRKGALFTLAPYGMLHVRMVARWKEVGGAWGRRSEEKKSICEGVKITFSVRRGKKKMQHKGRKQHASTVCRYTL